MPSVFKQYYCNSEEEALRWILEQRFSTDPTTNKQAQSIEDHPHFPAIKPGKTLPQPLFRAGPKKRRPIQLRTIYKKVAEDQNRSNDSNDTSSSVDSDDHAVKSAQNTPSRGAWHAGEEVRYDEPSLALSDMEYQFAECIHYRREGIEGFPFVMLKITETIHKDIVAQYIKPTQVISPSSPVSTSPSESEGHGPQDFRMTLVKGTAAPASTQLTLPQDELIKSEANRRADILLQEAKEAPTDKTDVSKEPISSSKRAAAIARSKAAASSGVVQAGKSTSEKRAAVQQQRKKRSKGTSATSSSKAAEKPNSLAEEEEKQRGLTVVRYGDRRETLRATLVNAIRQGLAGHID